MDAPREIHLIAARLACDQRVRPANRSEDQIVRRERSRPYLAIVLSAKDIDKTRIGRSHLLIEREKSHPRRGEGIAGTKIERRLAPSIEVRAVVGALIRDSQS